MIFSKCWRNRISAVLLLIAAGSLIWVHIGTPKSTVAQVPTQGGDELKPLDLHTYKKVAQFRDQMGLTNADLSAAGCSGAQVTQILKSLIEWDKSSELQLSDANKEVALAESKFLKALRAVNMGPEAPGGVVALETSKNEAEQARARRQSLIEAGANTVTAGLTSDQAQTVATARANRGLPERYRYLQLSAENRTKLKSPYGSAGKVDAGVESQATSRSEQVRATRQQSLPAVIEAESRILVLPPELNPIQVTPSSETKAK